MSDATRGAPEDDQVNLESRLNQLWQLDQSTEAQAGVRFGQVVGQYKIRAFLGAGSFGLVYLADDLETRRPVALKLPRIEVLLDEGKRKRFQVEAKIIGRLDHPGIVRVLRSDFDQAMPFIACDWCTGPDLSAWLLELRNENQSLPPWEQSVRLMKRICEAIHFAHENGITHRDIKPANVILDRKLDAPDSAVGLDQYAARITDFGLARLADPAATSTRTGVVLGSPAYMAPERIIAGLANEDRVADHSVSVAADVYGLGAVLFEMLAGTTPAQASSWVELIRSESSGVRKKVDWNSSNAPEGLKKTVEACLRWDPESRYPTAGAVAEDLGRLLNGQEPKGCPVGLARRCRLWFRRRDWMSSAGKFAMLSQAIIAIWLMLGDVFKIPFGLLTVESYFGLLPQLLLIAAWSSLSVIVAGWFCAKRKLWAALLGVLIVSINLYSPICALCGDPQMFREIYQSNNPYLSFLIHLVIAITFLLQLILFLVALVDGLMNRGADRYRRK